MAVHVLHERRNNELQVKLYWNPKTRRVFVKVRDLNTGDHFVIVPDPAEALDAFYHPFCYSPAAEFVGRVAA
jgi:hypothetical protein